MQKLGWIPIGKGDARPQLEQVVEMLKKRWAKRYVYRIEEDDDAEAEPYRLLVKHA